MTEFRPEVVLIEKVVKHPNADLLDICTVVNDYPVITKKGEFAVGEKAAYIPIDAILPSNEMFHFLCPKKYEKKEVNGEIITYQNGDKYKVGEIPEKYRIIKAKMIRDIYSQGLLVKIDQSMNVGDSVVDLFEIKKYEAPDEEDNINCPKIKGRNAESPPKGWSIPYYDIESVRKYLSLFKETDNVVVSEKLHGSNFSACHDGERLYVKSRNFYKKKDPVDSWWKAALDLDLEGKLSKYPMLVFFGELIGYNKKFPYNTEIGGSVHPKVIFFDIFDATSKKYYDYSAFKAICKELELETVPIIYEGLLPAKETLYEFAEGNSLLNNKHVREGVVVKPMLERYSPELNSRLFLKLVGKGFNLIK